MSQKIRLPLANSVGWIRIEHDDSIDTRFAALSEQSRGLQDVCVEKTMSSCRRGYMLIGHGNPGVYRALHFSSRDERHLDISFHHRTDISGPSMATMIRSMRLLSRRIRPSIESVRHSTTSSKPIPIKARVLEQPDKFRPPSHASKRTARKNTYPGPPLSDNEKTAQKSKQYPHMMPPSGTFMHWFLTSRLLHTWISLVRLTFDCIPISAAVGTNPDINRASSFLSRHL